MKTFSQMLAEGRDAPLYRGTDVVWCADSIMKDHLPAMMEHWVPMNKRDHGISMTRSFAYAKWWGGFAVHNTTYCVMELDQRLVAADNKIIPYNWYNSDMLAPAMYKSNFAHHKTRQREDMGTKINGRNEYEEFVIGPIRNLSRKLKAVYVFSQEAEEELKQYDFMGKTPRIIRK